MIQFLYPGMLAALSLLAIPVLIHLFNFRRYRKIYFSNISLLREVKEETRKQSRLKHLLILCCRLLAIFFLVLAFSKPFIPLSDVKIKGGTRYVSIYIDNSFTSAMPGRQGTLLEEAKQAAHELTAAYRPSDRFQLLTNDFEGKHQHWVSRDEFNRLLGNVQTSAAERTLREIISMQQDMTGNIQEGVKHAYLISPFASGNWDLSSVNNDTSLSVFLSPLKANGTGNLFIDSCWFDNPVRQINEMEVLNVRLVNRYSRDLASLPVTLTINGIQKAVATVDVPSGSRIVVPLSYTNRNGGVQFAEVKVEDYPVTFDNNWYLSYLLKSKIRILLIQPKDPVPFVKKVFASEPAFMTDEVMLENISYSELSTYDLLVVQEAGLLSTGLVQELKKQLMAGHSVCILPSPSADISNYRSALSELCGMGIGEPDTTRTVVESIQVNHPLFNKVFDSKKMKNGLLNMPSVKRHYPLDNRSVSGGEKLLTMRNGRSLFSVFSVGPGKLYISAVPLRDEFSNLQRHAVYVPLMLRMASTAVAPSDYSYTVGRPAAIPLPSGMQRLPEAVHLKSADGRTDFVTPVKVMGFNALAAAGNQVRFSGHYFLAAGADDTLSVVSYNYGRKQSEGKFLSADEMKSELTAKKLTNFALLEKNGRDMAKVISELNNGVQLWKWCILSALIFLGLEILVIRIFKG